MRCNTFKFVSDTILIHNFVERFDTDTAILLIIPNTIIYIYRIYWNTFNIALF